MRKFLDGLLRWIRLKRPAKPFVPGMTLKPGETAELPFQLPTELQALVDSGLELEFRQGPVIKCWHDYLSDVAIIIGGQNYGRLSLSWSERE